MNDFTKSIFNLRELEKYASNKTFIHRLPSWLKWIITVGYIVGLASVDKYDLETIIRFGIYPVLVFFLTDIEVNVFLGKLVIPVVISISFGLLNPIFDQEIIMTIGNIGLSGGWISLLGLILRSTFSISATLLLVATSGIEGISNGLLTLKVPKLFVFLLVLMYRYISVLLEETGTTFEAYQLRSGNKKGLHISTWGSLVGQIGIRAYYRSQEIYQAMELRGFDYEG